MRARVSGRLAPRIPDRERPAKGFLAGFAADRLAAVIADVGWTPGRQQTPRDLADGWNGRQTMMNQEQQEEVRAYLADAKQGANGNVKLSEDTQYRLAAFTRWGQSKDPLYTLKTCHEEFSEGGRKPVTWDPEGVWRGLQKANLDHLFPGLSPLKD